MTPGAVAAPAPRESIFAGSGQVSLREISAAKHKSKQEDAVKVTEDMWRRLPIDDCIRLKLRRGALYATMCRTYLGKKMPQVFRGCAEEDGYRMWARLRALFDHPNAEVFDRHKAEYFKIGMDDATPNSVGCISDWVTRLEDKAVVAAPSAELRADGTKPQGASQGAQSLLE